MCSFIKKLKNNHKVSIGTLRCYNAGENFKFKKLLEEEGLGVQFEFTAAYTPQHAHFTSLLEKRLFQCFKSLMKPSTMMKE